MLTNPNTLGLFEEEIEEIAEDRPRRRAALVYYDGANLNAILGRCRPGDMGFDIVHINTHKTFATPHGGGGPGAGPVGVVEELVPFLPAPIVAARRRRRARSAGTTTGPDRSVASTATTATSASSSARTPTCSCTARDGLKAVSELAALNANYLAALIADDFPLAFPDGRPMHEFVATAKRAEGRNGHPRDGRGEAADRPRVPPVDGVLPAGRGRGDDGRAHRDRDEGDARGVRRGASARRRAEARTDPDLLHEAPVTTPVRRLDEARAARHLKLRWGPDRLGSSTCIW